MYSHLDILRQSDGTFFEDKLCTCTSTGYMAAEPVKINPNSDEMPEPPPCKDCGGLPWMYFRQACCNCKKPFYRWFQVPMQLFKDEACYACIIDKALEQYNIVWDHRHGAIAPPLSVVVLPPTAKQIASKLDELFANL